MFYWVEIWVVAMISKTFSLIKPFSDSLCPGAEGNPGIDHSHEGKGDRSVT